MKISEALRIGAKLRPQCRGRYFDSYGNSCAVGAIYEAHGKASSVRGLYSLYPQADNKVQHPVSKENTYLSAIIIGLNDDYGWTREQIADWLESIGE